MSKAVSERYAAMARQSATRGSKRFIYNECWDDKPCLPNIYQRGTDNPFRTSRAWRRFRWLIHDLRQFGIRETVRKYYYLGDSWRQRASERRLMGIDELGNKFWQAWDSKGQAGRFGRLIEPADPHFLRGQDYWAMPPGWLMWLGGAIAHTPLQMKLRGEFGPNGRWMEGPWRMKWSKDCSFFWNISDPHFLMSNTHIVSPWYKMAKEAGFSRYTHSFEPMWQPYEQPHEVKQEVIEDYYGYQAHNRKMSRGQDHDDWGR